MEVLIWIGTAVALLGMVGIVWSGAIAIKARREGLDDAALRARLQRALPINLGALLLSILGCLLVILGVVFS
ncbi:hypothetical protein FHG66_00930 [Rubellimicrobium rubrum]|uniref:Uncharacterized protein n=1 Tax=Rubellimicrobium rubrum TaxID=2585369 RepID=A0A5C4N706_9RHOB|nr:hypothetical protein [Rubellimicrobium rubrum]TNC52889.1 hypothetical protein FHG66_00930 [Rubellimicrobium rubrum]